jgi:hypothetical protein
LAVFCDIRYLPNKLMRESGLDEEVDEIGKIGKDLEASAKEMQTSIKEMETSVKNEVDNAVKEMDVTVPVDDLEKTAQEIKKDLSNLASSQTEQSHTTITSPPPPVLDKTDQHSTENENVPPIDSADFEIDAKPISDTTAGLETTTSDASVVKNGTSDAPEIQQEDSPSELNKPQTETNIENQ